VLFAHLRDQPPTWPGLEQVLETALAKSPQDRYQSGRELVEAAREALGITRRRRARWPHLVVGAAVLAGAALLALALAQGGSKPPVRVRGNAVAEIDPGSNRVLEQTPVGANPEHRPRVRPPPEDSRDCGCRGGRPK